MSEISSTEISKVPTCSLITRVASRFRTLVSRRRSKIVRDVVPDDTPPSLMTMTPLCSPICCTLSCCHPFVALLPGNRAHRPSLQGSVCWMAPEVVKQTAYTKKADIWSVGCLVVEMLTGEHPWAQLTQMQAIFKVYLYLSK